MPKDTKQLKPSHWDSKNAIAFMDQCVVDHYAYRPPYPIDALDEVRRLIIDEPANVLDIGCGTGEIARNLVSENVHVDAIDVSLPMIENGKAQLRGDHTNLNWIHSPAETASLNPPYTLITAGESMHWLDWDVIFTRFKKMLKSSGKLVLLSRAWGTGRQDEGEIYSQFSTSQDFQPTKLTDELVRHGFYRIDDEKMFVADWQPTIDEYIASRHSRSQFSQIRMSQESVEEFNHTLREFIVNLCTAGEINMHNERLLLQVRASVCWGEPV